VSPLFRKFAFAPFFYFRKVNNGTSDAGVAISDIRVHCDENSFGVSEGMELCFPFKKSRITILRLHRYLYNTHAAGLVRRPVYRGLDKARIGVRFQTIQTGSGIHLASYSVGILVGVSSRFKEADHSPSIGTEVMNVKVMPHLSLTPVGCTRAAIFPRTH
jgi:hypothetical protein